MSNGGVDGISAYVIHSFLNVDGGQVVNRIIGRDWKAHQEC